MKLLFALCAESATLDRPTERLSLLHVVEGITAPSFPSVFPRIFFVAMFEKEQADADVVACEFCVLWNGQVNFQNPISVDFGGLGRARSILDLTSIPLQGPGVLRFVMTYRGTEVAAWSINVFSAPPGTTVEQR